MANLEGIIKRIENKIIIPITVASMLLTGCGGIVRAATANPVKTNTPQAMTQTYEPPAPVIEGVKSLSYSYFIPASDTTIGREINLSSDNLTLFSSGESGQIPCGYDASLSIKSLESNEPISTVTLGQIDDVSAKIDGININQNHVDLTLILNGICPKSSIDNLTYTANVIIQTSTGDETLQIEGEVFKPFVVDNLILPYNPTEMSNAINSPGVHLEYKLETRPTNHVRGPHLGDMIEIASDSPSTKFPNAPVSIVAPTDMKIINLWGFDNRRICLNSFVGYEVDGTIVYDSLYHIDSLNPTIKTLVSQIIGIPVSELVVTQKGFGDQVFHPNIVIRQGNRIGYFDHFTSDPTWGSHIASQLHINLTQSDPTDNLTPYKDAIDFSEQYATAIFNSLKQGESFNFIIDEGFDATGNSYTNTNPPPFALFQSYLPTSARLVKLDWNSVEVIK